MEAVYTATATAVGGRDGHVKSSDGVIDLDLKVPGAMGGQGGSYSNPEQLFAAGWAACFNGALNLMIMRKKVKATANPSVKVDVSIGKDTDGGFGLKAHIEATIPGVDRKTAEELVHEAHGFCPYSKATRGNIEATVSAKTE